MKHSNEFNDIGPKNQLQAKSLDKLITKQDFKKNDLSTLSVEKVDNTASSRRREEVKKKSNAISSLVKTFALLVSSVIIGMESLGLSQPSITATFEYIEAYEYGVYCQISLSEYQDDVKLILHNDFTNREQPVEMIEEDENWYYFEDLKPNMHYTLSIVQGKLVLATTSVYTQSRDKISDSNGY